MTRPRPSRAKRLAFSLVTSAAVVGALVALGALERGRAWLAERRAARHIAAVQSGRENPAPMLPIPGEITEKMRQAHVVLDDGSPWRVPRARGGCDWLKREYPHLAEPGAPVWPEKLSFCMAESFHDEHTGLVLSKGAITNHHEIPPEKPAGEVWIAGLGASSMELYTGENLSWIGRMEELLDGAAPGIVFRTHNYGIGGITSDMVRWRVENEVSRRPYDFAILYTGINDVLNGALFSEATLDALEHFYFDGDLEHLVAIDPWFGETAGYWRGLRRALLERIPADASAHDFDYFHFEGVELDRVQRQERSDFRGATDTTVDFEAYDHSVLRSVPPALVEGFAPVRDVRASIERLIAAGITPVLAAPPINIECVGFAQREERLHVAYINSRLPVEFEDLAAYLTGPYRSELAAVAEEYDIPFVDVHALFSGLDCQQNSSDLFHAGWAGIQVAKLRFAAAILDRMGIEHALDAQAEIDMFDRLSAQDGTDVWTMRPGFGPGDRPVVTVGEGGRLTVRKEPSPYRASSL